MPKPVVTRTKGESRGFLRFADLMFRYFLKYEKYKFTGAEVARVVDYFRSLAPDAHRIEFDDQTRMETPTPCPPDRPSTEY